MRLYVTKELTLSRTITFEVEVPDDIMQKQKEQEKLGHGPWPIREAVEHAEEMGATLNHEGDDEAPEWIGTDYQVYDHKPRPDAAPPDPIEEWDI